MIRLEIIVTEQTWWYFELICGGGKGSHRDADLRELKSLKRQVSLMDGMWRQGQRSRRSRGTGGQRAPLWKEEKRLRDTERLSAGRGGRPSSRTCSEKQISVLEEQKRSPGGWREKARGRMEREEVGEIEGIRWCGVFRAWWGILSLFQGW